MVRVNDAGRVENGKQYVDLSGLSTDDKPTKNILNGSSFFEIDTGDVYFFDEENTTWINPDAEEG